MPAPPDFLDNLDKIIQGIQRCRSMLQVVTSWVAGDTPMSQADQDALYAVLKPWLDVKVDQLQTIVSSM